MAALLKRNTNPEMAKKDGFPFGSIFLGKDEKTWGKDGIGKIAYDPDYECGGAEGTPGRKCPFTLKKGEDLGKEGPDGRDRITHVGLASYRDPLCPKTLYYLFQKAVNPHLIRVRVLQQNDPEQDTDCLEGYCQMVAKEGIDGCPFSDQVFIHQVHASTAKGPTYARGLLSKDIFDAFEKGNVSQQDFCLSMDSHMDFEPNWDTSMIDMWNASKNEYAVLSTYVDSVDHVNMKVKSFLIFV